MVLGISPGTRTIGIATIKDGQLTKRQLLSYPQKWSDQKLQKMLSVLEGYLSKYTIQQVAIKIPDELPISTAYIQLVGAINVLCEQLGIQAQYYTLSELKQGYFPDRDINKQMLISYLQQQYPELEYFSKNRKRLSYYAKIFEAVGVARLTYLYMHLPK